jgi:polyphosphate kinase 2 (PPK2 family)
MSRRGEVRRTQTSVPAVIRQIPCSSRCEASSDPQPDDPRFWTRRFQDIATWERHLTRSGTRVVKFFLHVSQGEQRRRFLARVDRPEKYWKFS